MRNSVLTFTLIGVILLLLVGLNVIFISEPRQNENEVNGNRSSYASTPYGTLALYTLLAETGHNVSRFEKPYSDLDHSGIGVLVIVVPEAESQPSAAELAALDQWVLGGGSIVVVDRQIVVDFSEGRIETSDGVIGAIRPVQPSPYTRGVTSVAITPFATTVTDESGEATVQFAAENGAVLIAKRYGGGHMVFLTEPYILQNNGIREEDNLALALNIIDSASGGGSIAFDEFHHGHGASVKAVGGLRGYIAGTPVPWLLAQIALVAAVIAISIGSRFARAVPLYSERRTSALEFVSSMANIQRLARASDLAIENVYTSFRARLCRYASLPSDTPADRLAKGVAVRGQIEPERVHRVLVRCETALAGDPPTPSELVDLVAEIRRIETTLKL